MGGSVSVYWGVGWVGVVGFVKGAEWIEGGAAVMLVRGVTRALR